MTYLLNLRASAFCLVLATLSFTSFTAHAVPIIKLPTGAVARFSRVLEMSDEEVLTAEELIKGVLSEDPTYRKFVLKIINRLGRTQSMATIIRKSVTNRRSGNVTETEVMEFLTRMANEEKAAKTAAEEIEMINVVDYRKRFLSTLYQAQKILEAADPEGALVRDPLTPVPPGGTPGTIPAPGTLPQPDPLPLPPNNGGSFFGNNGGFPFPPDPVSNTSRTPIQQFDDTLAELVGDIMNVPTFLMKVSRKAKPVEVHVANPGAAAATEPTVLERASLEAEAAAPQVDEAIEGLAKDLQGPEAKDILDEDFNFNEHPKWTAGFFQKIKRVARLTKHSIWYQIQNIKSVRKMFGKGLFHPDISLLGDVEISPEQLRAIELDIDDAFTETQSNLAILEGWARIDDLPTLSRQRADLLKVENKAFSAGKLSGEDFVSSMLAKATKEKPKPGATVDQGNQGGFGGFFGGGSSFGSPETTTLYINRIRDQAELIISRALNQCRTLGGGSEEVGTIMEANRKLDIIRIAATRVNQLIKQGKISHPDTQKIVMQFFEDLGQSSVELKTKDALKSAEAWQETYNRIAAPILRERQRDEYTFIEQFNYIEKFFQLLNGHGATGLTIDVPAPLWLGEAQFKNWEAVLEIALSRKEARSHLFRYNRDEYWKIFQLATWKKTREMYKVLGELYKKGGPLAETPFGKYLREKHHDPKGLPNLYSYVYNAVKAGLVQAGMVGLKYGLPVAGTTGTVVYGANLISYIATKITEKWYNYAVPKDAQEKFEAETNPTASTDPSATPPPATPPGGGNPTDPFFPGGGGTGGFPAFPPVDKAGADGILSGTVPPGFEFKPLEDPAGGAK